MFFNCNHFQEKLVFMFSRIGVYVCFTSGVLSLDFFKTPTNKFFRVVVVVSCPLFPRFIYLKVTIASDDQKWGAHRNAQNVHNVTYIEAGMRNHCATHKHRLFRKSKLKYDICNLNGSALGSLVAVVFFTLNQKISFQVWFSYKPISYIFVKGIRDRLFHSTAQHSLNNTKLEQYCSRANVLSFLLVFKEFWKRLIMFNFLFVHVFGVWCAVSTMLSPIVWLFEMCIIARRLCEIDNCGKIGALLECVKRVV